MIVSGQGQRDAGRRECVLLLPRGAGNDEIIPRAHVLDLIEAVTVRQGRRTPGRDLSALHCLTPGCEYLPGQRRLLGVPHQERTRQRVVGRTRHDVHNLGWRAHNVKWGQILQCSSAEIVVLSVSKFVHYVLTPVHDRAAILQSDFSYLEHLHADDAVAAFDGAVGHGAAGDGLGRGDAGGEEVAKGHDENVPLLGLGEKRGEVGGEGPALQFRVDGQDGPLVGLHLVEHAVEEGGRPCP